MIAAASVESFPDDTLCNAREFLALAQRMSAPPDQIGQGYWFTIRVTWGNIEFEIFPSSIEFYHFQQGVTDIEEFDRKPGQPFPERLVALIPTP